MISVFLASTIYNNNSKIDPDLNSLLKNVRSRSYSLFSFTKVKKTWQRLQITFMNTNINFRYTPRFRILQIVDELVNQEMTIPSEFHNKNNYALDGKK